MPRRKVGNTLGGDPLAPYLGETRLGAEKELAAAETRTRQLNGRIPEHLWGRLHSYYERQPRTVTKDVLIAEALELYLDAKEHQEVH